MTEGCASTAGRGASSKPTEAAAICTVWVAVAVTVATSAS